MDTVKSDVESIKNNLHQCSSRHPATPGDRIRLERTPQTTAGSIAPPPPPPPPQH